MSTPARKRLMRDFKRLQNDAPAGISGTPQDNNIMLWNAIIFGPDDTPWDGGTFRLTLQFTEDYPNKPPTVRFISKMFHPNIYADGSICLDILQNQWSPIYDVAAILTSIQVRVQCGARGFCPGDLRWREQSAGFYTSGVEMHAISVRPIPGSYVIGHRYWESAQGSLVGGSNLLIYDLKRL